MNRKKENRADRLRIEIEDFMRKEGLSNSAVAKLMDVSSAALSQWRRHVYTGDNRRMAHLVAQFLEIQKERAAAPKSLPFKLTRAAAMVFDAVRTAHVMNEFCIIISRAGYGKTEAIQQYARQHENVIVIEGRTTQQTHALLYELGQKLGVNIRNSSDMIFRRVVAKLQISPKIIIFDEAQLYNYRTLEIIRRIHDVSGCGVVLAGSYRLYEQMTGPNTIKDYDQIFSRVIRRELPPMDEEDVKLLLADEMNGEMTDATAKKLVEMCGGCIRTLAKNIKVAKRMMQCDRITMETMEKAHRYLIVAA